MPDPEVGKKYKHYKGDVYKVIEIENETICLEKDKCEYHIGIDMWNTPAVTGNNLMVERFSKYERRKNERNNKNR